MNPKFGSAAAAHKKPAKDGGLVKSIVWRCGFFQCFETQTPVSIPLPSVKSQKQPPGQLSLGAIQVVPHVAAVDFMLSAFTDMTAVAKVALMNAMLRNFLICAPFTESHHYPRTFRQ